MLISLLPISPNTIVDIQRVDIFGQVYDGHNPFAIGKLKHHNHNYKGILYSDQFGRVYIENIHFSLGEIDYSGTPGPLKRDAFGDFYVGSNPFAVDLSPILDK